MFGVGVDLNVESPDRSVFESGDEHGGVRFVDRPAVLASVETASPLDEVEVARDDPCDPLDVNRFASDVTVDS